MTTYPPDKFDAYAGTWVTNMDRKTGVSDSGGFVIEFKNDTTLSQLITKDFYEVRPGFPYRTGLRGYLSAVGASRLVALYVKWYDRDQVDLAADSLVWLATLNQAAVWETVVRVVEAPANARYAKVRFGKGNGVSGYFLYVDELEFDETPHAFRVHLSSDQAGAGSGSYTKVLFNATDYDHGNNIASSAFVAPVHGLYGFKATATIEDLGDAKNIIPTFYIDPVGIVGASQSAFGTRLYNNAGVARDMIAPVHDQYWLAAGDSVDVRVLHDHGAARNVKGDLVGIYTFFSGHQIR